MSRDLEPLIILNPEATFSAWERTDWMLRPLSDWERKFVALKTGKIEDQIRDRQLPLDEKYRISQDEAVGEELRQAKEWVRERVRKFVLGTLARRSEISAQEIETSLDDVTGRSIDRFVDMLIYRLETDARFEKTKSVPILPECLHLLVAVGQAITGKIPVPPAGQWLIAMKRERFEEATELALQIGDQKLREEALHELIQRQEKTIPETASEENHLSEYEEAMGRGHFITAAVLAQQTKNEELVRKAINQAVEVCRENKQFLDAAELVLDYLSDREQALSLAREAMVLAEQISDRKLLKKILSLFPELQVPVETEVKPVRWRILPPDWAEHEHPEELLSSESGGELDEPGKNKLRQRLARIHFERCRFLSQLEPAPTWYATRRFMGTPYYIVAVMANVGVFAECPLLGNALFFLPPDKGWEKVFACPKQEAIELGAKRIPHQKGWERIVRKIVSDATG